MKTYLFLLCTLCISFLHSQERVDFDNYSQLYSEGELPAEILLSSASKTKEDLSNITSTGKEKKVEARFYATNHYLSQQLMFSGRILIGDPVTEYINKVAKELLKGDPKLLNELSFYAYKSSAVNAFCTFDGKIMVTLGLMAKVKTEAELAYVLSHEIIHYKKQHSLKQHVNKYEVLKGKGHNSRTSFDDKVLSIYKYEQSDEFEADSIGILDFYKSNYAVDAPLGVMDLLLYAELPYREEQFDNEMFTADYFRLPYCFFKDSVAKIDVEDDYKDRYHSHPNLKRRRGAVTRITEKNKKDEDSKKDFIVSEDTFNYVQEISRFEIIRLGLLTRNYGNALYNAYLLKMHYPNNEYLDVSIAKALYGFSKYKSNDEFHRVAKSYSDLQGESQQLHYLMRQFRKVQLNTLALKHIMQVMKKYPNNTELVQYKNDLMKDLVFKNNQTRSDFYAELPSADILADFVGEYDGDVRSMKLAQRKSTDFYKIAFIDELKDEAFRTQLDSLEKEYKKEQSKPELTYKERKKKRKQELKDYKANGRKIFAKDIIVLDPEFTVFSQSSSDFMYAERCKSQMDGLIKKYATKNGIKTTFFNSKQIDTDNVDIYNNIADLKEWIQERYAHGNIDCIPMSNYQSKQIKNKFNKKYVLKSYVVCNRHWKYTYYVYMLYNLEEGKVEYKYRYFKSSSKVSMAIYETHLAYFMKNIKR